MVPKAGKAAEAGYVDAQNNLGIMYDDGKGVEQDHVEAAKWFQLAAVQGHENAFNALDSMQQYNLIPTPQPATAVTTILLASANAEKVQQQDRQSSRSALSRHGQTRHCICTA